MSTSASAASAASEGRGSVLLSVQGVSVRFGGITALDGLSFDVAAGEIVGLIGPNGAGKTTLFNCLSRVYAPDAGEILLEGRSILGQPPHAIAALGIARTFQHAALFEGMSVRDNIKVGCHCRTRSGFGANALRLASCEAEEQRIDARADELVAFMGLELHARLPAHALPLAMKKRVELARALAGSPNLLLLDEPAAGLNHAEIDALRGQIRRIRDNEGVTVLLVEHHMGLVMSVSDRVVAIDFGKRIAQGTPAEVRANPAVMQAYLGTGA